MKAILYITFILSSHISYSQKFKLVDLIENETRILNGGLRSQFGGKSRITIPLILIPRNAVGIVYTVQAYKTNENVEQGISLALSMGALLSGNIPMSTALAKMKIPSSTQTVDLYLLPSQTDAQLFLNKVDGRWKQYLDYAKEACMDCRVIAKLPFKGCTNTVIGIRNPSGLDAIKIVVNVAAVIPE